MSLHGSENPTNGLENSATDGPVYYGIAGAVGLDLSGNVSIGRLQREFAEVIGCSGGSRHTT
jgi:hypothetical protein